MNLSPLLGRGGIRRLTVLSEEGERVLCRGWRDDGDGSGTLQRAASNIDQVPYTT
jgi:hypothetical protein